MPPPSGGRPYWIVNQYTHKFQYKWAIVFSSLVPLVRSHDHMTSVSSQWWPHLYTHMVVPLQYGHMATWVVTVMSTLLWVFCRTLSQPPTHQEWLCSQGVSSVIIQLPDRSEVSNFPPSHPFSVCGRGVGTIFYCPMWSKWSFIWWSSGARLRFWLLCTAGRVVASLWRSPVFSR